MPLFSVIIDYIQTHTLSAVIQIITTIPYSLAFWRKKKTLLRWIVISSLFFTVGYLLEAAYDGVVISVWSLLVALLAILLDKKAKTSGIRTKHRLLLLFLCIFLTTMTILFVKHLQEESITLLSILILLAATLHFTAFMLLKENGLAFSMLALSFQVLLVVYECILYIPFFALLDIITFFIIGTRAFSMLYRSRFLNTPQMGNKG